jgi:hypothetical protein
MLLGVAVPATAAEVRGFPTPSSSGPDTGASSGTTTIGVFRPAYHQYNAKTTGRAVLRNTNDAGAANRDFVFGAPGDIPVAGDWDGNGTTTIGVFRTAHHQYNTTTTGRWILSNANAAGTASLDFAYGAPGDIPVTVDWDGS